MEEKTKSYRDLEIFQMAFAFTLNFNTTFLKCVGHCYSIPYKANNPNNTLNPNNLQPLQLLKPLQPL